MSETNWIYESPDGKKVYRRKFMDYDHRELVSDKDLEGEFLNQKYRRVKDMSLFEDMTTKVFEFKTRQDIFWKERDGVKNNTVRKIDLSDERFRQLIGWMESGWNDGDIQIRINNADDFGSFIRDIRDITIWNDLMIITWNEEKKR